jgi:Tetratricopeptide repeat
VFLSAIGDRLRKIGVFLSAIGVWLRKIGAVHVAHRLAAQDAVQLYVNLQGTDGLLARDPADVLREWLRSLGLEDGQIAAMSFGEQQGWYRSLLAELGGVVVLDNARDAAQVVPLLPGRRRCRVLVTSRESLGLPGVQPLRLDVMEPGEALERYETAIAIYRQVGDRLGEANVCDALALACMAQKDYASALQSHQQALSIFQSIQSLYDQGWSWFYIAQAQIKLGKFDDAQQSYQSAQKLFESIGMDHYVAMCQRNSTSERQSFMRKQPLWIWFGMGVAIVLVIWWLKHR